MRGKLKKNIGFSLIIIAFFFLFEPRYALIDPLPDVIGYIILCSALINLADINDRIYTAFKAYRRAAVLSALRIASMLVLRGFFADDEQTVGLLLFVFIFTAAELWVLIPAYRSLFEGLLSLGIFEGGEAVYKKKRESGRNASERLYTLTFVFLIVKALLESIPEFTTLESNTSYEFISIMRTLSCILIIPIAMIWLVSTVIYFTHIKKDRPFIEALEDKYREKATLNPNFFKYRTLCVGLYMIALSCFLTVNVYSERVDLLPDMLAYCVLLMSAVFLHEYTGRWGILSLASVIGALSSTAAYISEKQFYGRYTLETVNKDIEAYESFYFMLSLDILQAAVFILTVTVLLLFLTDIFKKHISSENEHEFLKKESKRGMTLRVACMAVLCVLCALSAVYRTAAHTINRDIWILTYADTVSSIISIVCAGSAFALLTYMVNEIKQNHNMSL